ncbi:MAG: glycosyltransferase family 39 protein [Parcubacteria group bacterium]|jgi:4-amino-4-deoxy-L-arabinose transferase-like glycosyltransferase
MTTKRKTYILLFLILAVAFFLRIVNIENTPPGIYPDEAVNAMDALDALHNGNWQWFYEANNGREGLMMNLNAILFKFMGVSVLALKLPNILFGTFTALGMFFLTKELLGSRRAGLIAAFLSATAFWSLNFSRMAFRANMLPFVLAFAFYFLWKGVRTKNYWPFVWGGMFFGLGLHTYIAFRIAPLILVVAVITLMINRKRFLADYWKQIFVFVVFATIVAAPMLYTFYKHPEYIQSRTANVSVFNPEVNQGHLVSALAKSIGLSIVKYNIWGDQNWRHNYPPYAILDPITGVAFTFGFIYVLLKFIHLWSLRLYKKERHYRLEIYTFLLAWFFVMLIPEFMTAEGNPHALRAIGTMPVVFLIAAMTFEYFFIKSDHYSKLFKKVTVSLLVFILLFVGIFNSIKYHLLWAKKVETAQSFDRNIMDMVGYIKSQPESEEILVVIESMQRIPIQVFNWERPNLQYFYPAEIDQIDPATKNPLIMITDYNEEILNKLQIKFPELELEEKKDGFGLSYYILK